MPAGGRLELRDPQALDELRDAIAVFACEAADCMASVNLELRREQELLAACVARRQAAVERAREALVQAEARSRDNSGQRRSEDVAALLQAARRALVAANEALEAAKRSRAAVEAAVQRYRRQERALADLAGPHSDRARLELRELSERYAAASTAARASVPSTAGLRSDVVYHYSPPAQPGGPPTVTWSGSRVLSVPPRKLEAYTLALTDQADIQSLIEAREYFRRTRGLYTGDTSWVTPGVPEMLDLVRSAIQGLLAIEGFYRWGKDSKVEVQEEGQK